MSDTSPKLPSIFDERPGVDANDDPRHPENIAPDVIAPDLGDGHVFGENGVETDPKIPPL